MARRITKLAIERMRPGRHSLGFGLSVLVAKGGSRQYVWRGTVNRQPVTVSMGATALMDPDEAMAMALEYKREARKGNHPVEATTKAPTLRAMVAEVIAAKRGEWKDADRRAKRAESLTETYAPRILGKRMDKLTVADVESTILAIWRDKHRTAETLVTMLDRAFAIAVARGYSESNIVATVKGILPNVKQEETHQASCGYRNVARVLDAVAGTRAAGATKLVIRFIALTGLRSREAAELKWNEIDMASRVITIPASRMKSGREFRLPISGAMRAMLDEARNLGDSDFVFDSGKGGPIGKDSATNVIRKLHRAGAIPEHTIHGFRSCLRDWAAECTKAPREVCEMLLAHRVGSAVELAYRRTDYIQQRAELLEKWAQFATSAIVTGIHRTAA